MVGVIATLVAALSLVGQHETASGAFSFELVGNYAYATGRVNGEPAAFVFDTGAAGTAVDADWAKRAGMSSHVTTLAVGVAGATRVPLVTGVELELGSIALDGVSVGLVPLAHLAEVLGRPIDAIVGGDVLRGRVVTIDHGRRRITAAARESFQPDGWGRPCAFAGTTSHPRVRAEVQLLDGNWLEGSFAIDTGARHYVELAAPFVADHGLKDRVGKVHTAYGRGLTNQTVERTIGAVRRIRFCGYTLPSVSPGETRIPIPAGLSRASAGVLASGGVSGLIGNGVLKRFDIALDVDGRRLFLRPNEASTDPIETDASGLFLVRERGGRVRVAEIVAGSPASRSDIQRGDELVAVDGDVVRSMDLEATRARLRQVGRARRLTLSRNGTSVEVVVTLEALGGV